MNTWFKLHLSDDRNINLKIEDNRDIDPATLSPLPHDPPWVKLGHNQCRNCPLDKVVVQYCPAAYDLHGIISKCSDLVSFEQVVITKRTEQGSITTETNIQRALMTVIATSGVNSACPVLNNREWVLDYYTFILSPENLFYISLSSYLVRQFLISTTESDADFELKGHVSYIDEALQVFCDLLERVRDVSNEDGSNNALVLLVSIGKLLKTEREAFISELKEKVGIHENDVI